MSKPSEIWKEVKPKIGEMLREINDMESRCKKAQEEAYQRGYETAKRECEDCPKQAYTDTLRMDVYQKGLSDAWEAAKKIYLPIEYGGIPADVLRQMFDNKSASGIFKKVSAPEAVKKVQQYIREQEEKQHVWIFSEANEPGVDTTLTCSKCGYTITIKPGDTQALNFCPRCGDNKNPKEGEA